MVGVDLDDEKVHIARDEARLRGVTNVEFRAADIRDFGTPARSTSSTRGSS